MAVQLQAGKLTAVLRPSVCEGVEQVVPTSERVAFTSWHNLYDEPRTALCMGLPGCHAAFEHAPCNRWKFNGYANQALIGCAARMLYKH